jgi:excisionase family DNA binding protein|tara:strand:- start:4193 stop:4774 length:582 start_codon:yes stop_codon:yes gene_type:complete
MHVFEKDVLTTGEVAKICNVASRTVSKWFDSGQIQGYRIPGSKDRRIPVASLVTFMKEHGIPMDGLMSGNPRVLIVDQEAEVLNTLQSILRNETSYEVRTADSTFSAGMECERFRPHVLLMDIQMDESNSRRFCNWIRSSEDHAGTRIIAMSSRLNDGQATQLAQQGYDASLKKPFSVRQLIDSIEQVNAIVY